MIIFSYYPSYKISNHDAGVAIVPGTSFGEKAVNHVRFSFAASQDDISNALEKIKNMLGIFGALFEKLTIIFAPTRQNPHAYKNM